jgi:hypothetical protein
MVVTPSIPSSSVTLNLGFRRPFVAFSYITAIDSLIDFDFDYVVAADIYRS